MKKSILKIFFIFIFYLIRAQTKQLLTNDELRYNLHHIISKTSFEIQREAALGVIGRIAPNHTHLFDIEIVNNNNNTKNLRSFELIKPIDSKILLIRATDGISACKGFYHYLKYHLKCHISWSEYRIEIPDILPPINKKSISGSLFIYHQNVCTWGYSFTWWTWHDWRRHIDWMALMGISMSIAPIQEEIWTRVYYDLGLTKEEIDDHMTGPAFLPWLRMGNIRGWGGPVTDDYKIKQLELQKQIIKSSRELGMTIAIPGFDGHVPSTMKRIFPNTTMTPVDCWNKFPRKYCCPLFVEPDSSAFKIIGIKFLREAIKEYGTDHLYFLDPFNEVNPRVKESNYLAKTSNNIYRTITDVDSKGIWLLQGWMFTDVLFWSRNMIRSFLTAVPQGKILILDLMSEVTPQYERTNSYFGQPFIWCMLHNFGGTLGMHGSIDIVNTRMELALTMQNSTMIGFGITPEGINQNYAIYEFALERGWAQKVFNITGWFIGYIESRYGTKDKNLENTWNILLRTVYAYKGITKLHGKYTITRRPSLKIESYTWYNPEEFKLALESMLQVGNEIQSNKLYQHDLVDITRQFLQLVADQLFIDIKNSYNSKNLTILNEKIDQMISVFIGLEKILASNKNFLLGNWLKSAKEMANTELEEQNYELNARNQITIWGPNGQITDYAAKQWSGVVRDYFLPRWRLFLNELYNCVVKNRSFNEKRFKEKVFRDIEHPFTVDRKIYMTIPRGNTLRIANNIWNKWKNFTLTDKRQDEYIFNNLFTTPTVIQKFVNPDDHTRY